MKYSFLLILLLAFSSAQAAVLHLKNGDRVSGKLVTEDQSTVKVATVFAGEIAIDRKLIAKIEKDAPSDHGAKAQQSAQAPEKTPRDWKATIDLSTNMSRGNTDSALIHLQAQWQRQVAMSTYTSHVVATRQEVDDRTTQDSTMADFGYNHNFDEGWFFAVNAKYGRDPISFIKWQYSLHPGIGKNIWADNRKTLTVQVGTGYSWEDTAGGNESSELIDWRLGFNYNFPGNALTAFHNNHAFKNLSGRQNSTLHSQTGLRYNLSKDVQLKLQMNFDYDSRPVASAEKDDLTLLIGAGLSL